MFRLKLVNKMATVDDWEKGEVGNSNYFYINMNFEGNSIQEVINSALDFLGTDKDGYQIDIDAELGRIDFQTMETGDGMTASESELKLWKKGKLKLWACYYTGCIEQLNKVDLTKVQGI